MKLILNFGLNVKVSYFDELEEKTTFPEDLTFDDKESDLDV